MRDKFFRPGVIWFCVWLGIFLSVSVIGTWQVKLYWQDDLAQSGKLELTAIRTILPYALAYLEDRNRADLIQRIVNTDLGPYTLVITDPAGKIIHSPPSLPAGELDAAFLKRQKFYILHKDPTSERSLQSFDQNGAPGSADANGEAGALGRLYLVAKKAPTLMAVLDQAYWKVFSPSDSVLEFTLLSYIVALVGFAGICAITARFQRHFLEVQEKRYEALLEARELRIQVLESNIKSADLRLQLLDRSREKAQSRLESAKNTIAELEVAIRHEYSKNEELQEGLRIAESDRDESLELIQSIELDRERITKELKELEVLKEVEEMNSPEAPQDRAGRPKEFLWLNLVYKNLQFSRRALQNIIELQYSHDIFPSLPDALAALNNCTVESLLDGGAIPSRSVVKYSQPLAHHAGDFWEYRFSKDGRIFFGISRSKTWNIDTILLKRKFSENRFKYEKYLEQTLGKDNSDLQPALNLN